MSYDPVHLLDEAPLTHLTLVWARTCVHGRHFGGRRGLLPNLGSACGVVDKIGALLRAVRRNETRALYRGKLRRRLR